MEAKIGDVRYYFEQHVLKIFEHYSKRDNGCEAGGILLGRVSTDSIYVCRISVPGTADKRKRFSFIRSRNCAQQIINYEFLNSQGKIVYLGEWHTHPEDHPKPSSQDIKELRRQFDSETQPIGSLLEVVVGRDSVYIGVYDGKSVVSTNVVMPPLD